MMNSKTRKKEKKTKKSTGKKAYFFSLDAIIAVTILTTGIFLVFFIMSSRSVESPTYLLSEDIMTVLAKTKINNLSAEEFPHIHSHLIINTKEITNTENTILEQIGEFYYLGKKDLIKDNLLKEILTGLIPYENNLEINIYIPPSNTGESLFEIYNTGISKEKSKVTISTKKIIFGKKPKSKDVWGPYIVEVRVWR